MGVPSFLFVLVVHRVAQNKCSGRVEIGAVYLTSQLKLAPQSTFLYVMVDKVKGGGRGPPTLIFSTMMEYTPESGHCHPVCTLWTVTIATPFASM